MTQIEQDLRSVDIGRGREHDVYYVSETEAQDIILGKRDIPSIAYRISCTKYSPIWRKITSKKKLRALAEGISCRQPMIFQQVPAARHVVFGDEMSPAQEIVYARWEG